MTLTYCSDIERKLDTEVGKLETLLLDEDNREAYLSANGVAHYNIRSRFPVGQNINPKSLKG